MLAWRFDGLYGQDPYAYFDYGVGTLRHSLLHGAAIAPMVWPLGFPLPVTLASLVVGTSAAAGQSVSLGAAAAAVLLTYLFGRDLFIWSGLQPRPARWAAAAGALLLAATGWMLESAVMIMPDSLAVATSVLSAWALVRWCREDTASPIWLALAGAALAWSAVTRWGQLVLAPVWLVMLVLAIQPEAAPAEWLFTPAVGVGSFRPRRPIRTAESISDSRRGELHTPELADQDASSPTGTGVCTSPLPTRSNGMDISGAEVGRPPGTDGPYGGRTWIDRDAANRLLRTLPWLVVPAAVILGTQLWLAFTVKPAPGLGRWPFLGDLSLVDGSGSGWSLAHLFHRSFVNADGSQHHPLPNGLYYTVAPFLPKNLTPLALPAVLLGAWAALTRYRRSALLLLGWPAAILLLDAGLAEQNIRFVVPALPPLALLGGLGLVVAGQRLAGRYKSAGLAALAALILIVAGAGLYDMRKVVTASATDRQTAHWAAAHITPGAMTVAFEITATLAHSTAVQPVDLSEVSATQVRRSAWRHPVFLLVRVPDLLGQWANRAPGEIYWALSLDPGLTIIGRDYGYTLFRVRGP
jgi:hypothetical protein